MQQNGRVYVVGLDVLVDGRIVGIIETGFLHGEFLSLTLVYRELQNLEVSSKDSLRIRGKRGLEVLEYLRNHPGCSVEILEVEEPPYRSMHEALVYLALSRSSSIITINENLQETAGLQGVTVLSIPTLVSRLRPLFATGDSLKIDIIREGEKPGQGIGFLDYGTSRVMVVVNGGKGSVGSRVEVTVREVIQKPTGDIIFAILKRPDLSSKPSSL